MRTNRYRYSQFSKEEYQSICNSIQSDFQNIYFLWSKEKISNAEFVAEYLYLVLSHVRPKDYLGAERKNPFVVPISSMDCPRHEMRGRGVMTALELFSRYSVRSIPDGALKALCSWSCGAIQLEFLLFKPTAEAVLQLQAEGKRVITLFARQQGLVHFFDDARDPYSFTIHDLIHADLFFHDPEQYQKQTQFFQMINEWKRQDRVVESLKRNKKFQAALDYISSDMNSHSSHMWSYFQHMISEFIPTADKLSEQGFNSTNSNFLDSAHTLAKDHKFLERPHGHLDAQ